MYLKNFSNLESDEDMNNKSILKERISRDNIHYFFPNPKTVQCKYPPDLAYLKTQADLKVGFSKADQFSYIMSSYFLFRHLRYAFRKVTSYKTGDCYTNWAELRFKSLMKSLKSHQISTQQLIHRLIQALVPFRHGFPDFYIYQGKIHEGLVSKNNSLREKPSFQQFFGLGSLLFMETLNLDDFFIDIEALDKSGKTLFQFKEELYLKLLPMLDTKGLGKSGSITRSGEIQQYLLKFNDHYLSDSYVDHTFWKEIIGANKANPNLFLQSLFKLTPIFQAFIVEFDSLFQLLNPPLKKYGNYVNGDLPFNQINSDAFLITLDQYIGRDTAVSVFLFDSNKSYNPSRNFQNYLGTGDANNVLDLKQIEALHLFNQKMNRIFTILCRNPSTSPFRYINYWSQAMIQNKFSNIREWQKDSMPVDNLSKIVNEKGLTEQIHITPDDLSWLTVKKPLDITGYFHRYQLVSGNNQIEGYLVHCDGSLQQIRSKNIEEWRIFESLGIPANTITTDGQLTTGNFICLREDCKVQNFVGDEFFNSVDRTILHNIAVRDKLYIEINHPKTDRGCSKNIMPDGAIRIDTYNSATSQFEFDTLLVFERLDYIGVEFRNTRAGLKSMEFYPRQKNWDCKAALVHGLPYIATIQDDIQLGWYLILPLLNLTFTDAERHSHTVPHVIGLNNPLITDSNKYRLGFILGSNSLTISIGGNQINVNSFSFKKIMLYLHEIVNQNYENLNSSRYFTKNLSEEIQNAKLIQECFGIKEDKNGTAKIHSNLIILRDIPVDPLHSYRTDGQGYFPGITIKKVSIHLRLDAFWQAIDNITQIRIQSLLGVLSNEKPSPRVNNLAYEIINEINRRRKLLYE